MLRLQLRWLVSFRRVYLKPHALKTAMLILILMRIFYAGCYRMARVVQH